MFECYLTPTILRTLGKLVKFPITLKSLGNGSIRKLEIKRHDGKFNCKIHFVTFNFKLRMYHRCVCIQWNCLPLNNIQINFYRWRENHSICAFSKCNHLYLQRNSFDVFVSQIFSCNDSISGYWAHENWQKSTHFSIQWILHLMSIIHCIRDCCLILFSRNKFISLC